MSHGHVRSHGSTVIGNSGSVGERSQVEVCRTVYHQGKAAYQLLMQMKRTRMHILLLSGASRTLNLRTRAQLCEVPWNSSWIGNAQVFRGQTPSTISCPLSRVIHVLEVVFTPPLCLIFPVVVVTFLVIAYIGGRRLAFPWLVLANLLVRDRRA
jgi:hypothetical protein